MRPHRQPSAGFSLLEMMTVVALIGIVTSLAVGSLEPLRARLTARHAAEVVAAALGSARERAAARGRCVYVELLTAEGKPVEPGDRATALRLRPWARPGCSGAPRESDLDPGERIALPQTATVSLPKGARPLHWLPNGRPRDGRTLLETRYGVDQAWVEAVAQGVVCLKSSSAPGGCP